MSRCYSRLSHVTAVMRLPADAALIRHVFYITDKVVPGVGLVVTVYDILDITGGDIYPSDGAAIFDVQFRLAVFLPFVGEVIVGRLVKSNRWAWRVDAQRRPPELAAPVAPCADNSSSSRSLCSNKLYDLLAAVPSMCSEGLHVSLGFFSDILIPKYALQLPTRFDTNDQLWWAAGHSP